jgi:hypothetical protein
MNNKSEPDRYRVEIPISEIKHRKSKSVNRKSKPC